MFQLFKRLLIGIVLLGSAYAYFQQSHGRFDLFRDSDSSSSFTSDSSTDALLANAFASKSSDFQVSGRGTVIKLLPDDNEGSRHQKFILELGNGQTLLVAHNIDLAPRIGNLQVGDELQFNGEYAWNPKGGVIHWTHHDPGGSHEAGWLRHRGKTYQ